MKPTPFRYHAPATVEEALALLAEHGDDAKVLAGGQSLVPAMNFRLAQPSVLIDLNRIPSLSFIRDDAGGVAIGAMTRQRVVEQSELVAARAPLVTETMPSIAHVQIRNRGTFGGSLAHADPAAELPAVALVCDAQFRLRSHGATRTVAAHDFFTDLFETALDPDELLTEVALPPMAPGTGWAFRELSRRHGDYALVGVAVRVTVTDQRVTDARIALLSVGPGPVMAHGAQAALVGRAVDSTASDLAAAIDAASRVAAHDDIDPSPDIHATVAYRRHLAHVLTQRALTAAVARAVV